jgi:hypothetical protein
MTVEGKISKFFQDFSYASFILKYVPSKTWEVLNHIQFELFFVSLEECKDWHEYVSLTKVIWSFEIQNTKEFVKLMSWYD